MKNSDRLTALDGLRGLAILLVFLNHIDSHSFTERLPSFIKPFVEFIFSSGTIGVSILFILSGLLMSYIYENPKNNFGFLQKRYTRIFPLFISMAFSMTLFRIYPLMPLIARMGIIVFFAAIGHIFWVYVVQKRNSPALGKILFVAFLLLQLLMAATYIFIMRHPPIYFNQTLPSFLRDLILFLVNITLTLPFGNYIPMLDGVYWSLISEVLFYFIFCFFCIPFIKHLSVRSKKIKLLFLISLLPFFVGLHLLSARIMSFQMIFPSFFIYFATGISVGYMLRHSSPNLQRIEKVTARVAHPVIFFMLLFIIFFGLSRTEGVLNIWIRVIAAFPLTILCISLLDPSTALYRFFTSRYLIYLGVISYSIYLTHTSIVDGMHLLFRPNNIFSNIVFITVSFALTLLVAHIVHYLLEKPYFKKSAISEMATNRFSLSPVILSSGLFIFLSLIIFAVYSSRFNFFSYERSLSRDTFISPQIVSGTQRLSVKDHTQVVLRFRSSDDKFGILTLPISSSYIATKNKKKEPSYLVFQIKETGEKEWYAVSKFRPAELGVNTEMFIGFPFITMSKNKSYDVVLYMSDRSAPENIYLHLNKPIKIVYQLNKREFISEPRNIVLLLASRVTTVISNEEVRHILYLLTPFIGILFFISLRKRGEMKEHEGSSVK